MNIQHLLCSVCTSVFFYFKGIHLSLSEMLPGTSCVEALRMGICNQGEAERTPKRAGLLGLES